MLQRSIPVLRMFDVEKTKAFYIDWLGFEIQFEHRFHEGAPNYIGIKRDDIEIHLSEHHGDCTPVSNVFMVCSAVEDLFNDIKSRPYKFYNPSLEKTFYNTNSFFLTDPSGNKLSFNEYLPE